MRPMMQCFGWRRVGSELRVPSRTELIGGRASHRSRVVGRRGRDADRSSPSHSVAVQPWRMKPRMRPRRDAHSPISVTRHRARSPPRGRGGDGVGTEWGRSGDGVGDGVGTEYAKHFAPPRIRPPRTKARCRAARVSSVSPGPQRPRPPRGAIRAAISSASCVTTAEPPGEHRRGERSSRGAIRCRRSAKIRDPAVPQSSRAPSAVAPPAPASPFTPPYNSSTRHRGPTRVRCPPVAPPSRHDAVVAVAPARPRHAWRAGRAGGGAGDGHR